MTYLAALFTISLFMANNSSSLQICIGSFLAEAGDFAVMCKSRLELRGYYISLKKFIASQYVTGISSLWVITTGLSDA